MIRRTIIAALLTLSLAPLTVSAAVTGGDCETWSAEINYPRDSYRLRQLGCYDPALDAVYVSRPGLCNQVARQAARAGLRGNDARLYVEAHEPTCYWDVAARNYGVRSVAW